MSASSNGVPHRPLRENAIAAPSSSPTIPRQPVEQQAAAAASAAAAAAPSSSMSPPRLHAAADEAALRLAVAALHDRESDITARLDSLVASQASLTRELGRLDVLRAGLGAQVLAARTIGADMLSAAAGTAGRLSGRVRALDLEKSRVEATLGVVEQVAELKACVNGVVGSMGAPQDWEAAAGYLQRAGRVPGAITRGAFAERMVPSVEVPDAPWATLEGAREALCGLFLREFERAAREGDSARVARFFKLFPLVGRADVGLDVYGRYVCQGVAGTARATLREGIAGQQQQQQQQQQDDTQQQKNDTQSEDQSLAQKDEAQAQRRDAPPLFYAAAMTRLFQHIAHIVDGHGALVERHYGAGKMVRVIERIQMEADVQGGIILDTWADERGIDRRLTDVKSYPFSFLVQSFLPQPPHRGGGGGGGGGVPRGNSPGFGGGGAANARSSEDEGVNMKEVDGLLHEISVMLEQWSFFTRFLSAKCMYDTPEDAPLKLPDLLVKSKLYNKVSTKLITPYNVMSTFFFRRSVEKAFQLDEYPAGLTLSLNKPIHANAPYIIMAVDDVMYIVNAVLQRCFATSQREVVCSVLATVSRVLESDFVGMIQRKMRDEAYPKPATQGGLPPEDRIIHFIVLINSLDMANEYLVRIINSRVGGPAKAAGGEPETQASAAAAAAAHLQRAFPFERDVGLVMSSLRTLETTFVGKTSELIGDRVLVLFNQVVKARLRPVLSDTFRDADYALTEEEFEDLAQQYEESPEALLDQVPLRFEHGWEPLMRALGRLMTPGTFGILMDLTARYLSKILEKRVLSHAAGKASAYGAIRMERDLTGIIGVVSRGDYTVRDAFGRVVQLLMVANMEDEEWEEVCAGEDGGMEWVLTDEEKKKARSLVRG